MMSVRGKAKAKEDHWLNHYGTEQILKTGIVFNER